MGQVKRGRAAGQLLADIFLLDNAIGGSRESKEFDPFCSERGSTLKRRTRLSSHPRYSSPIWGSARFRKECDLEREFSVFFSGD